MWEHVFSIQTIMAIMEDMKLETNMYSKFDIFMKSEISLYDVYKHNFLVFVSHYLQLA
jgi:hypothetical protein